MLLLCERTKVYTTTMLYFINSVSCSCENYYQLRSHRGFPGGSLIKNLLANAGNAGDQGWTPESGRVPWRGKWQPTHVAAWKIPWKFQFIKEPEGLQTMGSQRVRHDWALSCTSSRMVHDISLLSSTIIYWVCTSC